MSKDESKKRDEWDGIFEPLDLEQNVSDLGEYKILIYSSEPSLKTKLRRLFFQLWLLLKRKGS